MGVQLVHVVGLGRGGVVVVLGPLPLGLVPKLQTLTRFLGVQQLHTTIQPMMWHAGRWWWLDDGGSPSPVDSASDASIP